MRELLSVFVDGETKTGKGAASQHIAAALSQNGLKVYYDVAGDFYRRYVALVRQDLGLSEADDLLSGEALQQAAQRVYETRRAFEKDDGLGDLQRPSISRSVPVLGELALAQRAAGEWWAAVPRNAWEQGAEALVLDGRNPRTRLEEQLTDSSPSVRTALDLYMTCDPTEAARRILLGRDVTSPTVAQIEGEKLHVITARERDRQRQENPFIAPIVSEHFMPGVTLVSDVLARSWQQHEHEKLPVAIVLDNSAIPKPAMLAAVSELAIAAIRFQPSNRASI